MRVSAEPALVLQSKPYRETSALVALFTQNGGRLSAVLRGGRRRGGANAALQPFNEVTVGYGGRGGLMTLHTAEILKQRALSGDYLAGGFYVLELINRLLREHDPHPRLYAVSAAVLDRLQPPNALAPLLRVFERRLLADLGFAIDFQCDRHGDEILPEARYVLVDGEAFEPSAHDASAYAGSVLQAVGEDDYTSPEARRCGREVFAAALAPHLGDRPLASRALLRHR